jgi:nickel superoxide dismutase
MWVYDPASARVAAEAVQSMTKKMNALESNHGDSGSNSASYINTMSRYAVSRKKKLRSVKMNFWFFGQTSSNLST